MLVTLAAVTKVTDQDDLTDWVEYLFEPEAQKSTQRVGLWRNFASQTYWEHTVSDVTDSHLLIYI